MTFKKRVPLLPIVGLGSLWLATLADPSLAVRTRHFRTEGYDALKRGKLEGAALSEFGILEPAPDVNRLGDPELRSIWALVGDERGALFIASGDQGQVLVLRGGGAPQPLASLFNYELFGLAADGKGGCWAAGAPSGSITHVDADGATRVVFDAPEGLILGLLAGKNGDLFAAAGERGRLYQIPASGEARVVTESGDLHLRCLTWSSDGTKIWAGTDGRGLVQEIDPSSGTTRILYDAAEQEIVTLLPLPHGGMLFAANPGESGGAGGEGEPGRSPEDARPDGPVVYRMSATGSVRPFWKCPERTLHALLLEADGSFLAAAGSAGAVYRVSPEGKETVLWRADEEQVLSLARVGGRVYAGTGSPGRLYEIEATRDPDATYTSEVLDAEDQARWGALRWAGGEGAFFQTRSGYTSLPDDSWSEWSGDLLDPAGSQVTSPPGRYLQWRARWKGDAGPAAGIRRVEVAHIEVNRPPHIASLSISPDEIGFQGGKETGSYSQTLPSGIEVNVQLPPPPVGTAPGQNEVPASLRQLRSIVWEAEDPDGDEMTFALEIRRLGDAEFRLLKKNLSDPIWAMETGSLPDGTYELRLTASDAPANPPGSEETTSRLTAPFRVDTQPPTVADLRARRVDGPALLITGTASDAGTPIRRMLVAVDGAEFRMLPAKDGILDSATESFEARVPLESESGGTWVVVRVVDAAGNASSWKVWLEPEGER